MTRISYSIIFRCLSEKGIVIRQFLADFGSKGQCENAKLYTPGKGFAERAQAVVIEQMKVQEATISLPKSEGEPR